MKVKLVGMMIGMPNARDTRYCSDSVVLRVKLSSMNIYIYIYT